MTVRAAAEPIARARGLEVHAFMAGGTRPAVVRIEVLRGETVTCWLELPAAALDVADAKPGGVAELVEREVTQVTQVLRMRHGQGAAA